MGLSAGTRVGPYEIVAPIGAGGMGEVYRAKDTKLGREVALKILPDSFVTDAERLARFEREARTLASLNHPNIAQIYGMEERALVMELVSGDDLSTIIARGPVPVPEALAIARQIADALEAAHDQGVVHRDLKPANVKVRTDGTVKVLDFGLAKALLPEDAGQQSSKSNSPTLTAQGTQLGTILGTASYMAPEQARGKAVDRRADVWAFGVVVFEMLTGRRLFEGEEVSDVLAAVLRQDVNFNSLPAATPASVQRLLKRCLERDPRKRLSAIGDARLDIDEGDGAPTLLNVPAPKIEVARKLPIALIGAAVLLAAAAFFAGRYWPGQASAGASAVFTLSQVTDAAGMEGEPALSPDGASLAYVSRVGRHADIFVQRVGGRTSIPIAVDPTLEEASPAFSPKGDMIAFHVKDAGERSGIFVVGATGESARRVSTFGFHPSWSPDGQRLVFCTEGILTPLSRTATSELWTVEVKGGTPPVKLYAGDAVQPAWSPNNKRIAYWIADTGGQRDIATVSVAGGEPVRVTSDPAIDWGPKWSSDGRYLYFASDRGGAMNLWRVSIDESSGKPLAPPEPVTQGAMTSDQITLSRDGRIAFRSAVTSSNPATMSFDEVAEHVGAAKPLFDRTGSLVPTSVSPDGQWVAYWNLEETQEDLFVSRPDGSGLRRLTDDQARDRFPVWSPDSKELAFYSNRARNYNVYAIRPDGLGLHAITERAGANEANLLYPVYSPTGDRLVASRIRVDDTVMIDPRKPWSAQTPEKIPMSIGKEGWLVPNQWSPDGARLAGPILNATGSPGGVAVFDFATRKARAISNDRINYFGFAWLGDSRRVIYIVDDDIVLIDVDSGRRKVIPTGVHLGFGLALSPDRRTLYISVRREQADIWLGERPR